MKITINKELQNNIYAATFETEFTQQEDTLMEKFGEPVVNLGGDFTGPPAFTLADEYHKIKSGFPASQSMDANGDAQSEQKMTVWKDEVKARLVTAINDLRGQSDNYTGEEVETV